MKKALTSRLWRSMAIAMMLVVALPTLAATKRKPAREGSLQHAPVEMKAPRQLSNVPVPMHAKPATAAGIYSAAPVQLPGAMRRLGARPDAIKDYPQRADSTPVIFGAITYDDTNRHYGMVAIDNGAVTDVREHESMVAAYGGVYADGLYYNTYAEMAGNQVMALEAYLWDTNNNWRMIDYTWDATIDMMALALTADPISQTVYGIFYNAQGNGGEFGTLDIKSMKRSGTISTFDLKKYTPMSMSIDADGTVWMIDIDGALYTIDKATGKVEKKADTGLYSPYFTDGAIDIDENVYYYFVVPTDQPEDWALYAIYLNDGYKVEKCYSLPMEMGGVFIKNEPGEKAPGMPLNVTADFANGSLSGKIKFEAPSTLVDGSRRNGQLTYTVVLNDEKVATGTAIYGQAVEAAVTAPAIGRYDVRVYASNEEGMGPLSQPVTVWIGDGQPLQVKNLNGFLDKATGKVGLTWEAATAAEYGGYIVPSEVTYTITRYTDGANPVVVAKQNKISAFAEQLPIPSKMEGYSYEVVANYKNQHSVPAVSKVMPMGVIYPPYENDMGTQFLADYFDMLDVDNDGYALKYEDYYGAIGIKIDYMNPQAGANEWAFSQPVHMEKGKVYTLSMRVYNNVGSNGLAICTGAEAKPEAMNAVWFSEAPLTNCTYAAKAIQCTIRPEATGDYYLGFHVTGSAYYYRGFYMQDLTISEPFGAYAPNVVTDVEFVPPYENTPTATVKFTAPSVNVVGEPLTSISRIEVERDGKLVHTFNNPTFGTELSFVDLADEIGDYIYTFTGYNEYGTGYHYSAEGHVGIYIAKPPVNCFMEQYTDAWGSVKVTWDPVYEDINGYPVNPKWMQYVIGSGAGSSFKALVEGINPEDKEISLDLVRPNSGQALVALSFVPVTPYGGYLGKDNNGNDLNATTNQIFVGTPFDTPYMESFANQSLHYSLVQSSNGWSVRSSAGTQAGMAEPQDGDGGFLSWQPYGGAGSSTTVETANILIEDAEDMALSFYYDACLGHPAYDFYPYLLCEGDTVRLIETINTGDAAAEGWNRVTISLDKYRGKVVRLGFYVYCVDYYGFFNLDNIQMRRFPANDLALAALNVPKEIQVGKDGVISAQVRNEGYGSSEAAQVELYRDGKLMASKDVKALEPYTEAMVAFDITAGNFWGERPRFSAKVVWDGDEFDYNNTLPDTALTVLKSTYPAVDALEGTYAEADSSVFIKWFEPDYAPKVIEVVEDCENLDPFNFSNLGIFTTYDAKEYDGNWKIYGSYPGVGEPHAWFVMQNNPKVWNPSPYEYYQTARSGLKSFASYDANIVSDDWLISPMLPGEAQTITFYAATGEDWGSEEIEVYYSTTGTDIADFIQIGETIEVEEGEYYYDREEDEEVWLTNWNEISVDLPEGALYFAIRNVSDDVWAVYVDDITFKQSTEKIDLLGYNVYRNGEKLNEEPIEACTWSDSSLEPAKYAYHVEAVYAQGLAPLSEPYEVTVNAVAGLGDLDAAAVSVSGGVGVIAISGADGIAYAISNSQGMIVSQAVGTGSDAVAARPGVYVVKVADKAFKVVVK